MTSGNTQLLKHPSGSPKLSSTDVMEYWDCLLLKYSSDTRTLPYHVANTGTVTYPTMSLGIKFNYPYQAKTTENNRRCSQAWSIRMLEG